MRMTIGAKLMIGFGSMMFARHRGIASLGFVMMTGIGTSHLVTAPTAFEEDTLPGDPTWCRSHQRGCVPLHHVGVPD